MNPFNVTARAILTCLLLHLVCGHAVAAPVAPTDESADAARAPRSVNLSGGTANASKSVAREESKTIDLLIDLQDKAAPKGNTGRSDPSLSDGRAARPGTGSGTGTSSANAAATAYFGAPAAAQNSKGQDSERAEPAPSARQQTASAGPQGVKQEVTHSWLSAWMPRELLSWIRDHRFEVLAAALGTFALIWVASAAVVQHRR